MSLILDKKPDCRCCDNIISRCECIGVECQQCRQCEIHCECEEQAGQAKLEREKFDREETRILSIKQQENNIKAGLMRSGMKPSEAMQRARVWWSDIGRKLMHVQFNQEQVGGSFKASTGKVPGIKISPQMQATIPSGILQGRPWSRLNRREKLCIVNKWHECEVMEKFPLYKEKFGFEALKYPKEKKRLIQ